MARILVTRQIPQPGLDKLKTVFSEVAVNDLDRELDKQELINSLQHCDILLCMLSNVIDSEVIDTAPGLKGICNYAVGYNNIDLEYARSKGIIVTNTPDVLTETTADLAWALLMVAARRVVEGDALVRRGEFHGWEPMQLLGNDIYAKTLGIIGLGRIGEAVARRAACFGMNVIYYKPSGPAKTLPFEAEFRKLEPLLREADFISLHVPLTPQTRHLIGSRELSLMKPSAVLINTARGPVVDEAALVQALRQGKIFAAGLDVYENEPALAPGLAELPNVVLAPHAGSASLETRTAMAILAADNAIAILQGGKPPTPVGL